MTAGLQEVDASATRNISAARSNSPPLRTKNHADLWRSPLNHKNQGFRYPNNCAPPPQRIYIRESPHLRLSPSSGPPAHPPTLTPSRPIRAPGAPPAARQLRSSLARSAKPRYGHASSAVPAGAWSSLAPRRTEARSGLYWLPRASGTSNDDASSRCSSFGWRAVARCTGGCTALDSLVRSGRDKCGQTQRFPASLGGLVLTSLTELNPHPHGSRKLHGWLHCARFTRSFRP